jgi:hypothetical protein
LHKYHFAHQYTKIFLITGYLLKNLG